MNMATKAEELKGNPEFEALKDLDPEGILKQVNAGGDQGAGDNPPPPPPPPPPPDGNPPPPPPPPDDTQKSQSVFLKEIFGEQFKTIDEVKKANIVGKLAELETLRQSNQQLNDQLKSKPKNNFVNDEVAIFNEFVRETGVNNYEVFKKISVADLTKMDPIDVLVTHKILKNPEFAGKEVQIRKHFEKKYNVDPAEVNEEDLEVNKIGMLSDVEEAKKGILAIKEKLKVPDFAPQQETELTPEKKTALTNGWTTVATTVTEKLSKLNVPIKGSKSPLMSYDLTEDEVKETREFITNYAIENRMELTADNVKSVASFIHNHLLVSKMPEIVHSVFEKARKMTEKEVMALYENPNPSHNSDSPPSQPPPPDGSAEKRADDIFDAEMKRYGN